MAEKRLAYARKADHENRKIHIIAIRDTAKSDYVKGITLAAEEINSRSNKLLNRDIKIIIEDDNGDFNSNRTLIHKIVSNPSVVAVLGHRSSSTAVPASVIYEKSQIIFMPPFSTAQSLTSHNFKYVFRMLPGNKTMAEQLANAATSLGYKNMVILYGRDDFSRELAFLFEDAALKNGIKLVKRASFFAKDTNYRPIISQFNSEKFDAVFIASSSASTAMMASQMREMSLNQPIIGTDSVNKPDYYKIAGTAAEKTIFPIIYSTQTQNKKNQNFIKKFEAKYFRQPDYNAAQGYDSLMLLAEAIERAKSTLTPTISSTLHFMPTWVGVTGLHKFDQSGEQLGKLYKFNAWSAEEMHPLPALHNLYVLNRFDATIDSKNDSFADTFSTRMHEDDHKFHMLSLAYEALQFKRIGVIYEDTKTGRKKAGFDLLTALAKEKDVEIIGCKIPFSLLDEEKINKKMVDCYGKLSLTIDAMLAPQAQEVDTTLMHELSASLAFYKIPAITFDSHNMDPHTSLAVTRRSDVNKNSVNIYNGLLSGLKVHEFSQKIQGLPDIHINLKDLQRMGKAEQNVLLLAPDYFLETDDELGL